MTGIATEPANAPPPTAAPTAQPPRRRRPWLVLFGGLLVVTVVAGILLLRGQQEHIYQGTFSPIGSMTVVRNWPSSTLLPDGRVLVAGGLDATLEAVASAELYDPRTGTFSPTGSMATARGSVSSPPSPLATDPPPTAVPTTPARNAR
jgi:hypothetical protein